jgi:hypothetical protein
MLPGAWEELKGFQLNPATTLDGRTKELIGLAVAAQSLGAPFAGGYWHA